MSAINRPSLTPDIGRSVATSLWTGLSPFLIGRMWKLVKVNGAWVQDPTERMFEAALTDTTMEFALNWQSPFENSGAEAQAPTVTAMLQSGALQPLVQLLDKGGEALKGIRDKAQSTLSEYEGRTGITKLNSTQVFNGMQPVKITTTLVLRAWRDAVSEVHTPLDLFMSWALPQKLSKDGSIFVRAASQMEGQNTLADTVMPSLAPVPVTLKYKRMLFKEMVIESATIPLHSAITYDGYFAEMRLPIMLCSLTAIDRDDWAKAISI